MSELPSSEGLDPYPATDAPNPTTLSAAKSPIGCLAVQQPARIIQRIQQGGHVRGIGDDLGASALDLSCTVEG